MKVIDNESLVYFDCDDTLVMWFSKCDPIEKIDIQCPYGRNLIALKPHNQHVKLLKDYHARGFTVIVWSAAGYKWAEEVVKSLGLEKYVSYVQSKPTKYVDDLQANEILGQRVYLEDR